MTAPTASNRFQGPRPARRIPRFLHPPAGLIVLLGMLLAPPTVRAESAENGAPPQALDVFGAKVRVAVSGTVQLDVLLDFDALGLDPDADFTNEFITGEIPVRGTPAAHRTHRTGFSVNQSWLCISLSAPTTWGPLRIVSKVNFMGDTTGGPDLSLYETYGSWGPFMAGWAWSTFFNTDSIPDTLDYEGPNAIPELRTPVVRWTQSLPAHLSVALALEAPDADLTLPAGFRSLDRVPNVIVRLQVQPSRLTAHLAAMYRRLEARGNGVHEAVNGWGVCLSGNLATWGSDSLQFGALGGRALGAYIQDTQGYGLDAAPKAPGSTSLKPIGALTGWLGYQHWWTGRLRSTATGGHVALDNTDGQADNAYKSTTYASMNLIWSPVPPVDVGVEYIYGYRETRSAGCGHDHRVQLSILFNFGSG